MPVDERIFLPFLDWYTTSPQGLQVPRVQAVLELFYQDPHFPKTSDGQQEINDQTIPKVVWSGLLQFQHPHLTSATITYLAGSLICTSGQPSINLTLTYSPNNFHILLPPNTFFPSNSYVTEKMTQVRRSRNTNTDLTVMFPSDPITINELPRYRLSLSRVSVLDVSLESFQFPQLTIPPRKGTIPQPSPRRLRAKKASASR